MIIYIIITFSLYLLISQSFSLIFYPTKLFHLSHAILITCGAYFVFLFNNIYSMPNYLSVILAIIFTITIGIVFEVFIYKKMRLKKIPSLSYFIASLGLYIIFQNLISIYFGDDSKIINSSDISVGHEILGSYITSIQIAIVVISVSLFILTNIFLHFTTLGKSIRAVASNSELCVIYGVNTNKILLLATAIGSTFACIAGILFALDTKMTPTFGFNLLLYGVVAMIIGGVGSTRGLVLGSLLVASVQQLSAYYIDTKWIDAVTYIILIIFLVWKPLGFSGKKLKKVEV